MAASSIPIEVFFSYSHQDEELRNALEEHLTILRRQGVITGWHDRKIEAGIEWAEQIDKHLNNAQVILLLVSSSFLASDYCYAKEMMRAMERHERDEARVIPVILRACDWKGAPFGKLQALPRDAKPVNSWSDRDEALHDVVRGVRRAVEELARARTLPQPVRGSGSDSASETPISTSVFRQVHRFTGTVTIDGKPAPDGTRVSAQARSKRWSRPSDPLFNWIADRDREASERLEMQASQWGEVVETEVKDWKYRLEVPCVNQSFVSSKLEVDFRIDDLLVPDQTATWQDGGSTKLDLTAKSTPTYREAHRFTGTVTIGGKPAPEGTRVSAWRREGWRGDLLDRSDGLILLASTSVMHGRYRLLVYATLRQVTFKIDDLLIADQTATLKKGGDTQLDLTAEAFRP